MKLTLFIRAYEIQAQFDHFDDGSFEAFDVATAEIVGGERAGQWLRILVESNSPLAARWNRPGETMTVTVEPDLLDAQIVFAGAFTVEDRP
jgi:hypothetical protein